MILAKGIEAERVSVAVGVIVFQLDLVFTDERGMYVDRVTKVIELMLAAVSFIVQSVIVTLVYYRDGVRPQ